MWHIFSKHVKYEAQLLEVSSHWKLSWHHPTNSLTCVEITLGTLRKLLEGSQSQIRKKIRGGSSQTPKPKKEWVGDDPCKGFHRTMIVCSWIENLCLEFWDFLHHWEMNQTNPSIVHPIPSDTISLLSLRLQPSGPSLTATWSWRIEKYHLVLLQFQTTIPQPNDKNIQKHTTKNCVKWCQMICFTPCTAKKVHIFLLDPI